MRIRQPIIKPFTHEQNRFKASGKSPLDTHYIISQYIPPFLIESRWLMLKSPLLLLKPVLKIKLYHHRWINHVKSHDSPFFAMTFRWDFPIFPIAPSLALGGHLDLQLLRASRDGPQGHTEPGNVDWAEVSGGKKSGVELDFCPKKNMEFRWIWFTPKRF